MIFDGLRETELIQFFLNPVFKLNTKLSFKRVEPFFFVFKKSEQIRTADFVYGLDINSFVSPVLPVI